MPAGKLTTMPTIVDAAAMYPTVESGTFREMMNSGRAGLLAIVELKMASPPMMHKSRKGDSLIFIERLLIIVASDIIGIKLRR